MQLEEIAETVLFQEWSVLKNNQRLDFFVLLYQDKRTKKIRSDFLSDNREKIVSNDNSIHYLINEKRYYCSSISIKYSDFIIHETSSSDSFHV